VGHFGGIATRMWFLVHATALPESPRFESERKYFEGDSFHGTMRLRMRVGALNKAIQVHEIVKALKK